MIPNPPPLHSSRRNRFVQLARASWMSVIIACGTNIMVTQAAGSTGLPIGALLVGSLALIGVVSGIVALFGIRRYGRRGLLWPAVTGISLWLLLFGLTIPVVANARRIAAISKATRLRPAVHSPNASRVQDANIGFSFELPEGYEPADPAGIPQEYSHAFLRQTPNEPHRILLVKPLGGTLGSQRVQPQELPSGGSASLTTFDWRGVQIDGFRVPEKLGDTDYITFNIQVPLRTRAIQLGFGGPAAAESDLRSLVEHVLSTLEGETNW